MNNNEQSPEDGNRIDRNEALLLKSEMVLNCLCALYIQYTSGKQCTVCHGLKWGAE
jgi:hypothetical protein